MKFLKMFFYYLFILHFKKYIWSMSPLFFLLGVYAYASQNLQGRQRCWNAIHGLVFLSNTINRVRVTRSPVPWCFNETFLQYITDLILCLSILIFEASPITEKHIRTYWILSYRLDTLRYYLKFKLSKPLI